MRRNALALLGASALLLTAGCAGEGGSSASAAGSSTPSASGEAVLSATTAAGADAQVHQLFTQVLAEVRPKSGDVQVVSTLAPVPSDAFVAGCTVSGRVHHVVSSLMMSTAAPGSQPDVGPRAKALLQARDWTFGAWESASGEDLRSIGHHAGYTVSILYIPRTGGVQLIGVPPCLPGDPVAAPSDFPDSSVQ